MRILLSCLQSLKRRPIPAYDFWRLYLTKGCEEAGIERERTFLMPDAVDRVVTAKFRKVAESHIVQLGQVRAVDILEFIDESVEKR